MTESMRLLVACGAVVVLTLAGGLLPLLREWEPRGLRVLLAFGTGVLLGAVFFHMIPEAAEGLHSGFGPAVLGGFLLIYVLERFVMVHPCGEEHCDFHHMGLAAFAGITLHSLIDGLALGAGLSIPALSVAVTTAIVLHKLPASLALTGILLHCAYPRARIVTMMIVFSLSTPLGAVLSFGVLSSLTGEALHYAIAFSAGTFLAIATADLLPQVHSSPEGRYRNLAALFAGILVMTVAGIGHHAEADAPGGAHSHGEASELPEAQSAPAELSP
jgi:zinc and cadmium transporter